MNAVYQLRQVAVITGFEARRKVLSWRFVFPIICAVAVCILSFGTGNGAMASTDGEAAVNGFARPFLSSAYLIISVSAVVMSTESLSEEFERRSGYITFTKPLSRNVLFAGKFLSGFLSSLVITVIYYSLTLLMCLVFASGIPVMFWTAIPLAVLLLFAMTGVCMLFSSLAPRGSMAMMVAFLLLVVLQIFMQNVGFDSEPWYSLGYEAGIIGDYPLGDQTIFKTDIDGSLSTSVFRPNLGVACAVMSAYAIISTAFAAFVFRYRNM